jgi:hypothetical protein
MHLIHQSSVDLGVLHKLAIEKGTLTPDIFHFKGTSFIGESIKLRTANVGNK